MIGTIIGKIFGNGEVIKAGIDLIDDMHTSTEEEIAAKADAKVKLLDAYAPFKIAQRFLSLMFAGTYLLCFFTILTMTLAGVAQLNDVRAVINEFYIAEITFTIIAFYFGGGFIEGTLNARKGK